MTLRPFHQASWNEPILLELSTPGERGIIPPPVEPELTGAGQDALSGLPEALRRSSARRCPELSQPRVLRHYLRLSQETLGNDVEHPPRPRDLHDEVQPEGQRGAGPLAQGHRAAPVPGRRDRAGHARGFLPLRADAVRDLGSGSLHAAARRRVAGRVRERPHDARLPRRPWRHRARRDHHDDLLAPVRRGRTGDRRLQGDHGLCRREGLSRAGCDPQRRCPSGPRG